MRGLWGGHGVQLSLLLKQELESQRRSDDQQHRSDDERPAKIHPLATSEVFKLEST